MQKFTAIWQAADPKEREWIEELFGPYIQEHVFDGAHSLVLDNAILMDAFIYCFDVSYYQKFRGLNTYLVHFLDENYEGGRGRYENFRGVYRCHWADAFNASYVRKFPIGYLNGLPKDRNIVAASERPFLWSFAGDIDKSSRPDMVHGLVHVEPHYLYPTKSIRSIVSTANPSLPPDRYYATLLEAAFAPCPMGNVTVECFRLYEALECGAIPIVEKRPTLDYFRVLFGEHPIPSVSSWSQAAGLMRELVAHPAEMNALQQRCMSWWAEYKREFTRQAGEFFEQTAAHPHADTEPSMSKIAGLPFWQHVELLRHHSFRAAVRRVERQVSRLVRQGSTRVAYRASKAPKA